MKKISWVLAFLLLSAAAMLVATTNALSDGNAMSVYSESRFDNTGYKYGVDFYVDNNTGTALYAFVCITSRENVNGDKAHGVFIINPYEKHVRVASFVSADQRYVWSVNIRVHWASDSVNLPYVPGCN
ncbi:MAG: hypothetical protein Q8N77_01075 [Nanoarchaeota archaeon]|nr:hypothetical protein [Nanoarchaeota archaeon]